MFIFVFKTGEMIIDEHIQKALLKSPLFQGLDETETDGIFHDIRFRLVHFAKKEIFTIAGMPCSHADIIVRGEMVARMMGMSGRVVQIDRLGVGVMIAPAFIFAANNSFPVSVETSEDTTVFRMRPDELKRLIDRHETIRMNFIRQLSNIDVFLTQKLRLVSLFTVREKIAHFLIEAARSQGTRTIRIDQSRQEIADSFGIQKFSLLRCLSDFVNEGALAIDGKTITILNSDKLK